ncbi:MAG: hypothetical protein QOI54_1228 [Actinomycetota bacterium]|nr:hypothetical protein [Actinomycetota bacterium]
MSRQHDTPADADGDPRAPVGELVARLVADPAEPDRGSRGRELRSLTRALALSARGAGRASVLGGRWLTDLMVDTAPRIPSRDLATLQAQHPGLDREDLAQTLISGAAKASAAVGAAGGVLAAVEFAAPPTLLSAPAQIAGETLLIAAIEVKLIAELHEVYGVPVPATPGRRAAAYLVAWTNRRGLDPLDPAGLKLSLGAAAKAALRRRLIRRAGRNLSTMGPLMSGAVAGSIINHRETRRLGEQVRADLRSR